MVRDEFKPTDEDAHRAARDADQLMTLMTGAPRSEGVPKTEYPIGDVVVNVERLGSYLTMARSLFMPVYGLETDRGTVVCDPVSGFMSTTAPIDYNPWGVLSGLLGRSGALARWLGQMRLLSVKDAMEATRTHLSSYLATRIAGTKPRHRDQPKRKNNPHSATPPTTFLVPFRVYSQQPELTIEVSPAYFCLFTYFGSPTSPATGQVAAGNVIFRAHHGSELPIIDGTIVEVPKNTSFKSRRF